MWSYFGEGLIVGIVIGFGIRMAYVSLARSRREILLDEHREKVWKKIGNYETDEETYEAVDDE